VASALQQKRLKKFMANTFTKKSAKKKVVRKISKGRAYIASTYNNTHVSLTDLNGNVISWSNAGKLGFKGAKRSTPYAATEIVKDAITKAKPTGISEIDVFVRGIGGGREAAIRALYSNGLNIVSIKDITPIPHNGCRPPKVRRV
jgi:small subunit ribosomal protein S11